MLTPVEARTVVLKHAKIKGNPAKAPVTPALPSRWPPVAGVGVSYFVYATRGLSTSTVQNEIFAPHLRVDFDLTGKMGPVVSTLKSRLLATESEQAGSLKKSELAAAEQLLFDALAKGETPAGEAATRIRSEYRAWMAERPAFTDELRRLMPDFFRWVEER